MTNTPITGYFPSVDPTKTNDTQKTVMPQTPYAYSQSTATQQAPVYDGAPSIPQAPVYTSAPNVPQKPVYTGAPSVEKTEEAEDETAKDE